MRLALDRHYSPVIALQLRERGHDVVAARERGWHDCSDEELLVRCADEERALLTNNVVDLTVLARRWAEEGRQHAGVVFTSDASLPRTHATIGRYTLLLDALLRANPGTRAFTSRVHWL